MDAEKIMNTELRHLTARELEVAKYQLLSRYNTVLVELKRRGVKIKYTRFPLLVGILVMLVVSGCTVHTYSGPPPQGVVQTQPYYYERAYGVDPYYYQYHYGRRYPNNTVFVDVDHHHHKGKRRCDPHNEGERRKRYPRRQEWARPVAAPVQAPAVRRPLPAPVRKPQLPPAKPPRRPAANKVRS